MPAPANASHWPERYSQGETQTDCRRLLGETSFSQGGGRKRSVGEGEGVNEPAHVIASEPMSEPSSGPWEAILRVGTWRVRCREACLREVAAMLQAGNGSRWPSA